MAVPTPRTFLRQMIVDFEGSPKAGYMSRDPDDTGNWVYPKGANNPRVLVGSNYGVTGAVLAASRNVPLASMTMAVMERLTLDEAVEIAFHRYFDVPNFDLFLWNPVTASMVDMGWGAGPVMSGKLVQRMVGVADDGQIGQITARAVDEFYLDHGLEVAARTWVSFRLSYYEDIIRARPSNAKYRNGWGNRTKALGPGTKFWQQWELPKSNR